MACDLHVHLISSHATLQLVCAARSECLYYTPNCHNALQSFVSSAMRKSSLLVNQKPLTAFFSSPKSNKRESTDVSTPSKLDSLVSEIKSRSIDSEQSDAENIKGKRPRLDDSSTNSPKGQPNLNDVLGKSDPGIQRALFNKRVAELKRRLSIESSRSVLDLINTLHPEWLCVLENQIRSEKFRKLADFIMSERVGQTPIYPPEDQVFSWSHLCTPSSIRVVILGQDPYHGPNQAHGLAFSVCRPVRPPPSLVNMFKEIETSIPQLDPSTWPPKHGDLTGWARQGVLLLNAVLTVRASMPNSHKDKGWEILTDAVIRYLNEQKSHLVFMLWGSNAQSRGAKIDRKRHLVLEAPHPSPLSASRGFFGCGHFVKTNDYLKEHGKQPVDWTKLD